MAKYDGLLGQPILEVEEPDKEKGIKIKVKLYRTIEDEYEEGQHDLAICFVKKAGALDEYYELMDEIESNLLDIIIVEDDE